MPNVVMRQRARSHRLVFVQLYLDSDERGMMEIYATTLAEKLKLSRRAVYNSIVFLKRVNLLQVIEERRGRGRHSIVQINWKKPQRSKTEKIGQPEPSSDKKCAGLSIKDIKTTYLRYDRQWALKAKADHKILTTDSTANQDALWNRKMEVFRELLQKSWLLPYEQKICGAVLGRYIKNKSLDFSRLLYENLARIIHKLDAPTWVQRINDLCKWFMGVLTGLARSRGLVAALEAHN
ncbi:HTH domain-containing protein [Candidatus Acetothermia bacterium]|nr:HTH domain-containing protein [Candidatus Acetothermia bacterium]MBI3644339.1 HTH domain-containing protein [Candidatus Acetothermia bacterium]